MSELGSPGVDALFDQMRAMVKSWVKNLVSPFYQFYYVTLMIR